MDSDQHVVAAWCRYGLIMQFQVRLPVGGPSYSFHFSDPFRQEPVCRLLNEAGRMTL